jgi:hypothetical protein
MSARVELGWTVVLGALLGAVGGATLGRAQEAEDTATRVARAAAEAFVKKCATLKFPADAAASNGKVAAELRVRNETDRHVDVRALGAELEKILASDQRLDLTRKRDVEPRLLVQCTMTNARCSFQTDAPGKDWMRLTRFFATIELVDQTTKEVDLALSSVALVESGTFAMLDSPDGARLEATFNAHALPVGAESLSKLARDLESKLRGFQVPAALKGESDRPRIEVSREFKNDSEWHLNPTECLFRLREAVLNTGRFRLADGSGDSLGELKPAERYDEPAAPEPAKPAIAPLQISARLEPRPGGLKLVAELALAKTHEVLLTATCETEARSK